MNTCHVVKVFGGKSMFDCLGMNKEKQNCGDKETVENGEGGDGCEGGVH